MLRDMLRKTRNQGVTVGWERKAFEEMIILTLEKEREAELLYKSTNFLHCSALHMKTGFFEYTFNY
ncbi:hypothetical protein ACA30_13815 [Virgibacillus soli]|nr:hypothetical protein ACA30_13815 [Virgibacillus soli]